MSAVPAYREVWLADLSPTVGGEQAGRRPVLIVSPDRFNQGPRQLALGAPLTRTERETPLHVPVEPPEAGLRARSFVLPEMVRVLAHDRLIGTSAWGAVRPETMRQVIIRLRWLMPAPD